MQVNHHLKVDKETVTQTSDDQNQQMVPSSKFFLAVDSQKWGHYTAGTIPELPESISVIIFC